MSKTNESKLYNLIKNTIKNKAFIFRVESGQTIQGIPDLYIVYNGISFWLELKVNNIKNCNLSKYQINWLIQHQRNGGISFILNKTNEDRPLKLFKINPLGVAREVFSTTYDSVGVEAILAYVVKVA